MLSTIEHDRERGRFLATADGHEVVVRYQLLPGGRVDFFSTWVPPAVRRRGYAEQVVREALAWAAAEGLEVVASCPYVARTLQKGLG